MTTNFDEQLPDFQLSETESGLAQEVRPSLSGALMRVPVSVQVVIGSARLPLAEVAKLAPGATVPLEEKLGSPARMLVNGREVARGELFVINERDGKLGLTITEVTTPATQE